MWPFYFSMGRRKSQTGANLAEDANCDTLEFIMYPSPSPQTPNEKVPVKVLLE
jgi:hypothetical protein